jgi:hypothetical protein
VADPIDRARKLLALTVNPNENEARVAAYMLAQLIVRHDLEIVTRATAKAHTEAPEPPRARPAAPPHRRSGPRHMPSKYDCRCKGCGFQMRKGDWMYWEPQDGAFPGVWCSADCYPLPF